MMLVQTGPRPPDDPEEPKLADEGAGEEPKLDDEGAGAVAASARKASGEVRPHLLISPEGQSFRAWLRVRA